MPQLSLLVRDIKSCLPLFRQTLDLLIVLYQWIFDHVLKPRSLFWCQAIVAEFFLLFASTSIDTSVTEHAPCLSLVLHTCGCLPECACVPFPAMSFPEIHARWSVLLSCGTGTCRRCGYFSLFRHLLNSVWKYGAARMIDFVTCLYVSVLDRA